MKENITLYIMHHSFVAPATTEMQGTDLGKISVGDITVQSFPFSDCILRHTYSPSFPSLKILFPFGNAYLVA